jgi:NarL family two-component system response regulator LiaR
MKQSDQIKVLLVDDHAVVRSGLGAVLLCQDDMTLVGEAKNGAEALT